MQSQFSQFMKKINSDEFLQAELSAVQGAGDLVRLGRSMNFEFSETDVEDTLASTLEMAQEDLLHVAGGTITELSTGFATCPVRSAPRARTQMAEEELLHVAGGTITELSTGFATCPVRSSPRARTQEMAEEELLCVAGGTFNELSTGFATCPVRSSPR